MFTVQNVSNRPMKIRFSTFLLIFLVAACIEPYNITSDFEPSIVVQGMITDQPGPYLISISQTSPVDAQGEGTNPLSGANVKITDSNGYSEVLVEKTIGNFYTQNIQ